MLFRLVGWSLSAAVALVVLLYLAIPAVLRFGIPRALSDYGIASSIESARVDLAEETITLGGFNIGSDDGPGIRWGEVVARVDLSALLKGNIRIIDFQVKDARVDLQQLAAVKWDAPVADEGAGAKAPLVDVGDAVIRDLKFIGLSEQLGRSVVLRDLKLGSLSQLNAGDQIAFELNAEIGETPLKLRGGASFKDDLPVLNGRYELGSLALDGLGPVFGMAGAGDLSGKASGAGSFDLQYLPQRSALKILLSGRARVSEFRVLSGGVGVSRGGAEWHGDVNIDWTMGRARPSLMAAGSLEANRVAATYQSPSTLVTADAEGVAWRGTLGYDKTLSLSGRLESDSLRAGDQDGSWEMKTRRLAVETGVLADGPGIAVEAIDVDQALVSISQGGQARRMHLDKVFVARFSADGERVAFETLRAENAGSVADESTTAVDPTRWNAAGIAAKEVEIVYSGGVRVASAEFSQGKLDLGSTTIQLGNVRGGELESSNGADWRTAELSVGSLRHLIAEREIWGTNLNLVTGRYASNGKIRIDELRAEGLGQSSAGKPLWEISAARISDFSRGDEQISAGQLALASYAQNMSENETLQIVNAEAEQIRFDDSKQTRAERLDVEQLRYQHGKIVQLALADAAADRLDYATDGKISAGSVDVARLNFTDSGAGMSTLENVVLGELTGKLGESVRIGSAQARSLGYDGAGAASVKAQSIELLKLDASFDGAASAASGTIERISAQLAEGYNASAKKLNLERPSWRPELRLAAGGIRIAEAALVRGANRELTILDLAADALEPRDDGGHHITLLRANRAEALDEVIGTRLVSGALQLDSVVVSRGGRVAIGRGDIARFELADTRGTPAAAFSAARIVSEESVIDPGKLLSLGRITLSDASAFVGFSELGRFVLPKAPFTEGGEKSDAELSVERLETKGDSRLSFFDRSTTPPFELELTPFDLTLANYHSSDAGTRSSFGLEGRIDEFSGLKVAGELTHKGDGLDLRVDGTVTGFELKRLNTYAAKYAKRPIRAGRGDASFKIKIAGQELTGISEFVFSKVKFDKAAAGLVDQAQELSLDGAFAMLKDADDIVKISAPISGSLDDPRFDFSDALTQAVLKTLQNTVNLTFKPLGLLVSAAGMVGVKRVLRFRPVTFNAGDGNLTGEGLTHLDKLSRQLQKYPKVDIMVCGRAVPADLTALEKTGGGVSSDAELESRQRSLAESRAQSVRQYLQQQKSIPDGRLRECPAEIESTAGSLPRTDLLVYIDDEPQSTVKEPAVRPKPN